jgi:hypothetical protein
VKIVIVHWTDAVIHGNEVCNQSEKFKPENGISCGWLIHKDDLGITMALDSFGDGDCRMIETIATQQINAYLILEVIPKEKT